MIDIENLSQEEDVWRRVVAAGAILAGARGGVDASLEERADAARHLIQRYADFQVQAPKVLLEIAECRTDTVSWWEYRDHHTAMGRPTDWLDGVWWNDDGETVTAPVVDRGSNRLEVRTHAAEFRVDTVEENGRTRRRISGYAARFNSLSEDLGGFREKIAPGAFDRALAKSDIRVLRDHEPHMILGRNTAGTAEVSANGRGLRFDVPDVPDTSYTRDLLVSMDRGDISQCSFGFIVGEDEWKESRDGEITRTITDVSEIVDVSIVTFPAYPQTSAQAREARDSFKGKVVTEKRGASLAGVLNDAIGDGDDRPEIIQEMASAAGIEPSTVNNILTGNINCPPLSRLQGFARVLGVSASRLQSAAESDGCEYDGEGRAVVCPVTGRSDVDIRRRRLRLLELETAGGRLSQRRS